MVKICSAESSLCDYYGLDTKGSICHLVYWRQGLQSLDPLTEKWLDHEGFDMINGLIRWWINNMALFGMLNLLGRNRSLGLWKMCLMFGPFWPSASWMPSHEQLLPHSSSMVLLPCSWPKKNGASQPLTEISKTLGQNKGLLLLHCFSHHFHTAMIN